MKKALVFLLVAVLLISPAAAIEPLSGGDITIDAPYAILIERETGEVIYEKDSLQRRSPASVTKVMTLLIIMDEIANGTLKLDDMISVSSRAASMGGSQIWLEEGETMSVHEMLKCITVVSANDCCVAMAEHIAGTEEAFVARMNERATQLGCENTNFTCCSGLLENDNHYSCAYDLALISRELMGYELIRQYTTIWSDSVRGGEFALSNTNKLVRYYEGATGLKTGFTSKAMYCLAASAERSGTEYIAVVLGAQTSSQRFESAKTLLNYAFSNYAVFSPVDNAVIPPVKVMLGKVTGIQPVAASHKILVKKSLLNTLECRPDVCQSVKAPVSYGQILGTIEVISGEEVIDRVDLISAQAVEKQSIFEIFLSLVAQLVC